MLQVFPYRGRFKNLYSQSSGFQNTPLSPSLKYSLPDFIWLKSQDSIRTPTAPRPPWLPAHPHISVCFWNAFRSLFHCALVSQTPSPLPETQGKGYQISSGAPQSLLSRTCREAVLPLSQMLGCIGTQSEDMLWAAVERGDWVPLEGEQKLASPGSSFVFCDKTMSVNFGSQGACLQTSCPSGSH